MIHFCPECWKEIGEDRAICPHCGAGQLTLSSESFVRKLRRALLHPEPETPVRAAYILGQLRAEEAIPDLALVARTCGDPYIVVACATALGEIGTPEADTELEKLAQLKQQPMIVRDVIRKALRRVDNE